jgi:hypothetical protein
LGEFIPGLELSRAFYEEVVADLVGDVPHAAALLGTGSDVLGLDTERSTDHGWGPRLQVFVAAEDVHRVRESVDRGIPAEYGGWPTRFGWDDVPETHHIDVVSLRDWLLDRLGFDPRDSVGLVQWLTTPQQILLEVTRGAVHRDDDGDLEAVREALTWYPDDVWLWLLACQWRRLDQEEPFVGRTEEVGDELGSRIVAARLARDLIRLCFLLERRYAPYSKWLGTAFGLLESSSAVGQALGDALAAVDIQAREEALVRGFQAAAALHNVRGVTRPVDESIGHFHSRPFRVLGSSRFVDACLEEVHDSQLRALPLVGAIDQLADSVDLLSEPRALRASAGLYEAWLAF